MSKITQIPFEVYLQFLGLFFAILGHFSFVFQPMIEYQLMHRDYYLYTSLVAPILWTLGILCSSSVLLIFCVPATWLIILIQLFRLSDARFTMGVSYMIWLCFILITYLILFLKILAYHSKKLHRDHLSIHPIHTIHTQVIQHHQMKQTTQTSLSISLYKKLVLYWIISISFGFWMLLQYQSHITLHSSMIEANDLREAINLACILSIAIVIYSLSQPMLKMIRSDHELTSVKVPSLYQMMSFMIASGLLIFFVFKVM